jgi:PhnB protein
MPDNMPATPNGVIAYLTVKDGTAALDFYTKAFGAALQYKQLADDGKRLMHARMQVNGGVLMLSDDFPEYNGGVSMAPDTDRPRGIVLHMQVPDCDTAFSQAVAAGAAGIMPPADMFWGDRYARLRDPFGHVWSLAHAVRE